MTDLVEIFKSMRVVGDDGFERSEIKNLVVSDLTLLRNSLERILLDIKFMSEANMIPNHIFDDVIYQDALNIMNPQFLKVFNNV